MRSSETKEHAPKFKYNYNSSSYHEYRARQCGGGGGGVGGLDEGIGKGHVKIAESRETVMFFFK